MKLEFQNLGAIKKTSLDLRPLTVIVGPNNTNKTYLAYTVHGLLSNIDAERDRSDELAGGSGEVAVSVADVVAGANERLGAAARGFAARLPEYFQDTYGSLFKDTKLGAAIGAREVRAITEGAFRNVGSTLVGKVRANGKDPQKMLLSALVGRVIRNCAGPVLTLPAERNAFIITYKMLSARRFRALRDQARSMRFRGGNQPSRRMENDWDPLREQGDLRYPAPIEDFLDFLTDVELASAGSTYADGPQFMALAQAIEDHIQGGHRTAYESTKLGGRELALTIRADLRADLYNASSSIKQLAPLLLYLRYQARPKQTLIIDEPEMNLHPEGQAKLLEALAMLANLGVNVLLTTHSPYFMAHLNNLIASDSKSSARRARQAGHLYMGDPAAFLAPGDVSAYEMRPDGLASLVDPEYGIRWDTLSDVSAELQRRYFAITEEPENRGKKK